MATNELPREPGIGGGPTPHVSILIPAWNAAHWVGAAIDSALAQSYPHVEIIVLDDGSSDGTPDVARTSRVRVETQANAGANATRNRLLEMSSGEWVQFLDADDVLLPEKIERQLEVAAADADVVVAPALIDGEPARCAESTDPWVALFEIDLGCTSANLWRRAALTRVRGWDPAIACGQEYELLFRLLRSGSRCVRHGQANVVVRTTNADSVSRRSPVASIRRHAALIDDAVAYLERESELSPQRRASGASVLFRMARRLRRSDAAAARSMACAALRMHPEMLDSFRAQGIVYGRLLERLGFDAAEKYDRLVRPLRRLLALRPS